MERKTEAAKIESGRRKWVSKQADPTFESAKETGGRGKDGAERVGTRERLADGGCRFKCPHAWTLIKSYPWMNFTAMNCFP